MAPVGQIKQRQQGERAGRIEDFPGHPAMRLFVGDPGDKSAVAIVPARGFEARFLAGRALPPFRADQQAAFDRAPVAQFHRNAMLAAAALDRLDPA